MAEQVWAERGVVERRWAERASQALAVAAAIASALLIAWVTRSPLIAGAFTAALIGGIAIAAVARRPRPTAQADGNGTDWTLLRAATASDDAAIAVTDQRGRMVCGNPRFEALFGSDAAPPALGLDGDDDTRLAGAAKAAWREGEATIALTLRGAALGFVVTRAGAGHDHLIWRAVAPGRSVLADDVGSAIGGDFGTRLGEAGVMLALVDASGIVQAANRPLAIRVGGTVVGAAFASIVSRDARGRLRLNAEGTGAMPLRMIQVPLGADDGAHAIALIDDDGAGASPHTDTSIQALLTMLPLGLALADRDGRFLFINRAFARAAHVPPGSTPVYPGDLVVREDKAAVADAVRRFASGKSVSGDIAIRLKDAPDEPVALTLGGARGLGEAAVLLSIKDNSEESRLKREVAQATKMKAVGQLAGGLAHDFNNIVTAIIGNCDLMLMRHTPGDSDYDDIQQIKANSGRAAALTRQLLAFSRQQTLRPQVLQLPDVVAEVAHMLQRVIGENITLETRHGRGLGPVRADPGQLEQVIINLAINARDAMPGGGTLTISTAAVSAADVRRLGHEIMPLVDYTALSVVDTGTGIDPEHIGQIFEPFFSTKAETGKGTGLGLSMVYGIVKQSGGFIFAESTRGKGATFTIYLPVHDAPVEAPPPKPVKAPRDDLWGHATILLVEDEDMVRTVAERALTRHGYTVICAANGEEGLAKFSEHRATIDALVSDVVMPTLDGPALARRVRELAPALPVLFMSGYAEEQLRRSIDMDRIGFLPKPFSVNDLARAVHDILAD